MSADTKPIIGIVSKHFSKNEIRPAMFIKDEIKQAIFDNGGIAIGILLPKDEKRLVADRWQNNLSAAEYENLISQIALCDGIVLQGGGACDNYEMIAAKYCYDHDIPTLGICCGQNVMVRALGGTTMRIDGSAKHNTNDLYAHSARILDDTKLASIIRKTTLNVNSRHNKTIKTHPKLVANCLCEDGYIDGVEAPDKVFYMAFRFHSESLYKVDVDHNNIFQEFIKAAKAGR